MKIIKAKDYRDMSRKAANIISAQVILKPECVLGLATGSTPIGVYEQLIDWFNKGDIDFSKVKSVNLDEYVGLENDDKNSYRRFMNEHLFDKINILSENTHVPNGVADNILNECKRYDELIDDLGGIDMQLLGIGHDGHIGFNEPDVHFELTTHITELSQQTVLANSRFFDSIHDVPTKAITMGMKSIMQAKKILLIASGESKKDILQKALFGEVTPKIPASILQLHPDFTVIADCL